MSALKAQPIILIFKFYLYQHSNTRTINIFPCLEHFQTQSSYNPFPYPTLSPSLFNRLKMAAQATKAIFLVLLSIAVFGSQAALDAHYYDQTCPQADFIVAQTIRNASIFDPKVPARILRMFFHDCFIRV